MRSICLAGHQAPDIARGQERREGTYGRCLTENEVKERYRGSVEYGLRVHSKDWNWGSTPADVDEIDGLSVSCLRCARTDACAIWLAPDPGRFRHVVRIDLVALSAELGVDLVAIYDPVVKAPENPCHFVITSLDKSPEDLRVRVAEFMKDDFPPWPKLPKRPEDIARAKAAQQRYQRVFDLVLSVLDVGGVEGVRDGGPLPPTAASH